MKIKNKLSWWWFLHNPIRKIGVWLYRRELKKKGYTIVSGTFSTSDIPKKQ